MKKEHDELMRHLGRLQAIRHQITDVRRQLHERVDEQHRTLGPAIAHVEAHVERDQGGGILAARALRKMLVERGRLNQIIHTRDDDGSG